MHQSTNDFVIFFSTVNLGYNLRLSFTRICTVENYFFDVIANRPKADDTCTCTAFPGNGPPHLHRAALGAVQVGQVWCSAGEQFQVKRFYYVEQYNYIKRGLPLRYAAGTRATSRRTLLAMTD